ncbi:abnormal spindle-like microcephaly-associated protein [Lithobates pipiens]
MISISPPGREADSSGSDDTPLLSLTHFSRPPFVTFGCVEPGVARSAALVVENPSSEPAHLSVYKLPTHRGFTVRDTDILIPPFESVPLTITWTPLEEGGVRELVTFLVNDIVKHQAVLLGSAELPSKKKRARWNTITKKYSPVEPKFSGPKNKDLCSTVIKNKKFNAKHKNGQGLSAANNPLRSCENLSKPNIRHSRVKKGRRSTENKAPTHHVSPLGNDLQAFIPGSLKRSKTYSILCTTEYETIEEHKATSTTRRDFVEEQWTLTEHRVNKLSISPINPVHGLQHNFTCTPSLVNDFKTLSPTEFYNAELAVRHTGHPPEKSSSFQESFHECFTKTSLKTQTPPSVLLTPQRKVLSPDSFVSNSYASDEYLDAVNHTPVLSPDQFVKDNFLTPPVVEEVKTSNFRTEPVDEVFSPRISGNLDPAASRLTYCVKKKKAANLPLLLTDGSSLAKKTEKSKINSATVTKSKSSDCSENVQRPQLKSRRRLRCVEGEDKEYSQSDLLEQLPVVSAQDLPSISVFRPTSCSGSTLPKDTAKSICGHKRRSAEISSGLSGTSNESLNVVQAKRSHLSKPAASQHVNIQDHEQETKRAFSTLTPWKIHKTKPESKGKPTLVKSRQMDTSRLPQFNSAVVFKQSKRVVAVPQSKLTFMKSAKTVIPRHPMPFAAKNMFYDERWMAKQERGFTWWLNFILTPDDFAVKTDTMKVNAAALILGAESTHKVSVPKAPTKEEVSMKAYTARCRLNRLRRSACRLFTSDPVVKAIRRLEVEIEARRLLVRKDRHLWKDIGERQKILSWLLSYNPLWLRVGLETIFGELISLEDNNDVTGLALFILNRLLWNPDIAAEYRHPSVPNLYRNGHEEALSKFTLKKLLLLVFFLDYAKQSRLIDHDPCLFCKDADFKTSKDLLLAFSRDFLSGEGDLSRHLGYLGLPVSHVQTPLDEFDFAVTNLAVDLQCGVRLVRMMELLTHNWGLSKKLRVPAISRLQKMHNVEVALEVLTDRGVQIKDERGNAISSKDIVDRHRERTLALLWNIVLTFQVEVVLNVDHLKEEIKFLKHSYSTQKKLAALRALSFPAVATKRDSIPFLAENYSEQVLLLMEWINAICAFYNTKVENFTVSFSDGRVFCYLINHYHPSYVALDAIRQQTTQTIECSETGKVGLNSSSDSDNSVDMWSGICDGFTTSALHKELLANERTNFSLLQTAVSNLGGIPAMIHHSDTSNTIPDEKVVITFLSFLCARLLDLRKEARAARVIQAAWRKHKVTTEEQLLQKKHKAASVIQIAVRKFLSRRWILKRTTSAIVIQKHWRKYLAHKELMKLKLHRQKKIEASAAIVIQRIWRCYAARKYYIKLRKYGVLLQARMRTKRAVLAYKKTIHATKTLQRHVRAWLLAKKDREDFLQLKSAALTIQSAFRRWRCIKLKQEINAVLVLQKAYRKWQNHKLEMKRKAATLIQSLYRMSRERCKYLSMQAAAVKIQSLVKMRQKRIQYLVLREKVIFVQTQFRANLLMRKERKSFLQMRAACVKIQSNIKGLLVRKQIKLWHKAATKLQANYRMHMTRTKYLAIYRAAIIIQESFRANKVAAYHRESFLLMKCSAIWIQAACRGYIVRKRIKIQHLAALSIQTTYRCYIARKHYLSMRQSAISIQRWYRGQKQLKRDLEQFWKIKRAVATIQSTYRGWLVRRQLHKWTVAAVTIQSAFRKCIAQSKFKEVKMATLTIQRYYRAVLIGREERQNYLHICLLIKKVQATWRGKKVRQEIQTYHKMATLIQSYYRMHVCYAKYQTRKQAAVLIQCRYRAHTAGKAQRANYLNVKEAANCLQAAFRGWQTRKHILHLHNAACKIQATYRSFRLRKEYLSLKMATILVQRRYRTLVAAKLQRKWFLCLRKNTIKLQSVYRGMRTRQRINQMQRSAVLLQSAFKMQKQRAQYRKMKKAAVLIQKYYRAIKEGKKQQQQYLALKKSACTLQASFRGWQIRKHLFNLHNAACKIQTSYRSFRFRKEYLHLRMATILIQRRYRAMVASKLQRNRYLLIRQNTIKLQSVYRGMRTRQRINQMQRSAVLLQSVFKMQKQRAQYQKMKWASVLIQKHYRAIKEGRTQQQQYLELKKSACTLQAAFRGWQIRKHLLHLHNAACKIQTSYRSFRLRKEYLSLRMATILIQRRYCAMVAAKLQRKWYLLIRQNTIKLQSVYRGMRTRQRIIQMKRAAVIVQKQYRAMKDGRKQQQQYLALRKAACTLQAAWRGKKARNLLCRMHTAAIVIQAWYRMVKQQQAFKNLKKATVTIQKHYRASQERNKCLLIFHNTRKAILCIQSTFRTVKLQREFRAKRQAAVVIQRAFKSCLVRRRFLTLQKATVCIQRRFILKKLADRQRQDYLKTRRAALVLQAAFRGLQVRQKLQQTNSSATVIQASFRMHKERVAYLKLKQSAITIQQYYRAFKISACERETFVKQKKSAVIIQSAYRGAKVRQRRSQMNKAAFKIQASFKMHQCRIQYKKFLWAVCVIQQRYRANKQRDFDVLRYTFIKDATLLIQAAYRGWHVRKELGTMTGAATVIQKQFRTYLKHKQYLLIQSSALLIQRWYRATALMRSCHSQYQSLRKSAICIQASYRGFKVRKDIALKHEMAIRIQSAFRNHKALVLYSSQQAAARKIQAWYRSSVDRRHTRTSFLKLRRAAIVIQAGYRGMSERKNLKVIPRAATVIQSNYRMYTQKKYYKSLLKATQTVQQRYRAKKAGEQDLYCYQATKNSVVLIQAAFRGMKVRRQLKKMHCAATAIQRFVKGYFERKKYLKLRSATVFFQRRYRASVLARSFLAYRKPVMCFQSAYRGCKEQQRLEFRMYRLQNSYGCQRTSSVLHQNYYIYQTYVLRERECYLRLQNAAVVLQASYRGMKSRRNISKMHNAATIIQAFYRMHRQRKSYLIILQATKTLQLHFRAALLKKETVKQYNNLMDVVLSIQQSFRAKKSREIRAAVVIQTTWKMYRERRAFLKAKSAVVSLQAAFRGYKTRKRHKLLVASACHVQSWYRRCCKVHLHRVQYLSMQTSAIVIQSAFRGWVARKRVKQERAARILQSYYRMAVCRKSFLQLRASAIKLQTSYRMQKTMHMYKKQRAAALIIQKWYKSLLTMRCQRAAFLNARKQIILVQAAVRRFNAKRLFKRIQHAALMSQIAKWNTERRLLRFASAVYHHLCAVKIQRWFWAQLTLKKAQKQICHVIYIQRWYRSRLQRRKFLCTREKLVCVQHLVRSWLHRRNEAAVRIQRCVRVFLQRKQQAKVSCGVVKFQALWRGYQWRKANETKKMRTLRQRLRKLSEEYKAEDKLCNRTSVALNYLLSYKHFSYILAALKHLEAATRLSSVCCERMAQSGAVSTIFTLIRSCNRSIPCMEVITLSIQILLNLTKYEKTVSAVHEVEDSVEVLLNLMQIYREKAGDKVPEKGGSIFTKTCCLLAIFGLDPHRAKEIYAIPKAMNRISSIYVLTSRKHKMDTARNVSKQLMNNSRVHGNTSLQSTPFHTRIVSRIKPDWVLRKDNMREVVDPLQAIQLVMSTFGLPI